jgi:hypothetical protein
LEPTSTFGLLGMARLSDIITGEKISQNHR